MLKKQQTLETLELVFWNTTIPALTGAILIRQILHDGRVELLRIVPSNIWVQSLVWSAIGLTFGLVMGVLSTGL